MRTAEKYEIRKEDLFKQITDLITEVGYDKITIRGICARLGISTGTFYHYFNDKNDLVHVLFNDIDEYFRTEVPKGFSDDESANLVHFFECYGIYCVKNGVETCKCISVAPIRQKGSIYMADSRGITVTLFSIITRGIEKGQFSKKDNPQELTDMIMVMMRGYSADWAKKDGNYDIVSKLRIAGTYIAHALI